MTMNGVIPITEDELVNLLLLRMLPRERVQQYKDYGLAAKGISPDAYNARRLARLMLAGEKMYEAIVAIYYAGHWTCDRPCDSVALWTALRDSAGLERGKAPLPNHCPSCGSPEPRLHPAVQFEGEVQICSDPFHESALAAAEGRK